jgi:hypothetical protein
VIHIDLRVSLGIGSSAVRSPKALGALASAIVRDPVIASALVIAVVAAVLGVVMENRIETRETEKQQELRVAISDADSWQNTLDRAEELKAEQARLSTALESIRSLDQDRYAIPRFMAAVSASIPENVWLSAFGFDSYDRSTGSISFRLRGYSPSVDQASIFEQRLGRLDAASDVQLVGSGSTRVGSYPVVGFELTGVARTSVRQDPGYVEFRDPESMGNQ